MTDKKNTMLLTVIAVATLLVAVVGATFAYFTATSTGSAVSNVTVETEAVASTSLFATPASISLTASDMDKAAFTTYGTTTDILYSAEGGNYSIESSGSVLTSVLTPDSDDENGNITFTAKNEGSSDLICNYELSFADYENGDGENILTSWFSTGEENYEDGVSYSDLIEVVLVITNKSTAESVTITGDAAETIILDLNGVTSDEAIGAGTVTVEAGSTDGAFEYEVALLVNNLYDTNQNNSLGDLTINGSVVMEFTSCSN